MKFTILATSLLGLVAAAPAPASLENTDSHQARSVQDATYHAEVDKRALGCFGAAVVGGVVGPTVARFAGKVLGPEVPARKRSVTAEWEGLSWDDFRRKFLAGVVEDIYNADENRDADAAVCTGVGYSVSSPARTADSYAFEVEWRGQRQEFDCFILTGPSTFTVDARTNDTDIAVKVGTSGTFENGVVTLS